MKPGNRNAGTETGSHEFHVIWDDRKELLSEDLVAWYSTLISTVYRYARPYNKPQNIKQEIAVTDLTFLEGLFKISSRRFINYESYCQWGHPAIGKGNH